jgi:hypothetical protein
MRKRITPCSRRGSRWMSLARWSKAYCHSQSTTCTTPWSLASSCLLLAQLHQLLEAPPPLLPPDFMRRAHRLGQREELRREARDLARAGDHAAHAAPRLPLDLVDPVGDEGLGCRDHHLGRAGLHRQHLVALGIAGAHGRRRSCPRRPSAGRCAGSPGRRGAASHCVSASMSSDGRPTHGASTRWPDAPADAARSRPASSARSCAAPRRRRSRRPRAATPPGVRQSIGPTWAARGGAAGSGCGGAHQGTITA